jgi:cardiolipin synthase
VSVPFVESSPFPVRAGNFVRPLIDGLDAFRRICEAIESAHHNVFVTIAFIHPDFLMPDGRGSLFDVLDRATERGIDVRAVFWRTNPESAAHEETTFGGRAHQREMLSARESNLAIRWDRALGGYCHHQKSWIVDAGQPTETAFVGGINLNPSQLVSPGHEDAPDGVHDAYLEVTGPAAGDVHHNFAERWNGASERHLTDGTWGAASSSDLCYPTQASDPAGFSKVGVSTVQIQRTWPAQRERTINAQYLQAIDAAEQTIYIENQALEDRGIIARLDAALHRGVIVIALLPAEPQPALAPLNVHRQFTCSSLAARQSNGERSNIHIHAKLMLVDDVFATIGSCNLRTRSLQNHTELNASVYDPSMVRALRCELFSEHLMTSTEDLDDREALRLYAETARDNARTRIDWQGNVRATDVSNRAQDRGRTP